MPVSVGGGESCLGAADVDFNEAARRQFRRRAMKATLAVHTGTREAQGRGRFLVGLGGCSIERTVIRPRDPRTKGFSWRIGWSEKTKKGETW